MNYKHFDSLLVGRNKSKKKLARNTYAIRFADRISIRLRGREIINYFPDDSIKLDSCGYKTKTTKDRLNRFTPISISQNKGIWYVYGEDDSTWTHSIIFKDGMSYKGGKFFGYEKTNKKELELRKKVLKYCKNVVNALPLVMPGAGDCWYCYLKTQEGKPLGETANNKEHILNHLEENYLVPSLVWNALVSAGCNPQGSGSAWFDVAFGQSNLGKAQIGRFVKKYIYKQLGLAV